VYKLHGANDREAAELEYREMYDAIKAELSVRSRRLSDLWATRAMMRRTFVSVGVQVFCQFTGINGMNMFSVPNVYLWCSHQLLRSPNVCNSWDHGA
jgi:Sugar (and other) transporter